MNISKIFKYFFILSFLNIANLYSQEQMELSSERIAKTQNFTDKVLVGKFYKPRQDYTFEKDLLDKDFVTKYAVEVVFKLYPEIKNSKYSFALQEDKSGKLWFAYVSIHNAMDGLVTLIFVKKDGKLLYYSNRM